MNRLFRGLAAGLLLVLPVLASLHGAADEPPAVPPVPGGTWKVMLPGLRGAGSQPVWLLKIDSKDDAWTGKVLASGVSGDGRRWPKAEVEKVSVAKEALRFTLKAPDLTLPCEVRLVKGADKLFGETSLRGEFTPIELERTTLTTLEPFDQARESLATLKPGAEVTLVALSLLGAAEEHKVKPAEARSWAEKAVKSAELYGPGWHRETLINVAEALVRQKGYETVGLPYAQRAERMLGPKEPPAVQKRVLEVLATALEKAGKEEDAKLVQARLKKLDFSVKLAAYPGRTSKSDRVVLIEEFTGAGCKECVASDQAADALAKTFKGGEVVVLRYHLNAPESDPLAGTATDSRAAYYEVKGLPTVHLDGRELAVVGGSATEAQEAYDQYYKAVVPRLEKEAGASLKVEAQVKGGKINIRAEASKLSRPEENVRLRVVLVEEQVAYKGSNGLTVHRHVVRDVPGGVGTPFKDKTATASITIDLEELRKKHLAFLDKVNEKRPYPSKERPLELKKLRVVAFVQDDNTQEILQTAAVNVKEGE
jgi:hypothetical protein